MKLNYRNEKNAKFIASQYDKPLEKSEWYSVKNVADDEVEVFISDYIGWPFNDAGDFVRMMSGLKQSKIVIRINSPGGDVFDGFQIANAIKNHPSKPVTRVEALAASAASYIAVSGHEKQAYKNAMIMIHEPMAGMWGNQYEMMEVADILKKVSSNMIDMYVDNTNVGKRALKDMMKAETWMTAKEAKVNGFIDTLIEAGEPVLAKFDLSMFANTPEDFKAEDKKIIDPNIRDIENLLRDVGGLSVNKAKAVLARGWRAIGDIDEESEAAPSAEAFLNIFKK